MRTTLATLLVLFLPATVMAAGDVKHPRQVDWQFDGVFGTFDKPSIQRGLQVYKEVCSACHGLKRIPFRQLTDVGFSEEEVRSLAASYTIKDGPNDDGEMFDRPGRPSDKFPSPYANEKAARAVNQGAYPPDLSLIIKARHDGANYVYSLLTGYTDAPVDHPVPEGAHYNPYFPGGIIKMAQPIKDEQVAYQDETKPTQDQIARDVVNFLQWASEPEMQQRKRMGIKIMLFLGVMTVFFYLAKKRIWSRLDH